MTTQLSRQEAWNLLREWTESDSLRPQGLSRMTTKSVEKAA